MATFSLPNILTIGEVAERFGVRPWHVRRLYERGLLPEAARVGAFRVVPTSMLERIGELLRQEGYLA